MRLRDATQSVKKEASRVEHELETGIKSTNQQ